MSSPRMTGHKRESEEDRKREDKFQKDQKAPVSNARLSEYKKSHVNELS